MAIESKTPKDDGKPRPHAFTHKGMPCFEWIDGGRPMKRSEAIQRLRLSRPASLGEVTHVSLADAESIDAAPLRPLGEHRVQYNMTDMLLSQMGFQISVKL